MSFSLKYKDSTAPTHIVPLITYIHKAIIVVFLLGFNDFKKSLRKKHVAISYML